MVFFENSIVISKFCDFELCRGLILVVDNCFLEVVYLYLGFLMFENMI